MYWKYGNHTRITQNMIKDKKVMNKEGTNRFTIPFPKLLAQFILALHLTSQGLFKIKKEKRYVNFERVILSHVQRILR